MKPLQRGEGTVPQPLTPWDVFTPTRAPIKDSNVYVERTAAEAELASAREQGYVPVIFGEFGVGKTSLVLQTFAKERAQKRFVHYTNPSGKSLDDLYRQVLEQLGYAVEVSRTHTSSISSSGEMEGSFLGTLKAKMASGEQSGSEATMELLIRTPTDAGVLRVMRDASLIILIDELHQANDGFRRDLAYLIKSLSDSNFDFPVLIVAGTSTQPALLVEANRGIDRLVREVPVAPLEFAESEYIVTEGFAKLGLSIESGVLSRIISSAAGAPALLHAICLEAAAKALSRESRRVYDEDVNWAVQLVIHRYHGRLTQRYIKATNLVGHRRYRAQILRACAEYEPDYVTMEMLVAKVSDYIGEEVTRSNLTEPLRQLKSDMCGRILADVTKADGNGRQRNVTVFTDPQMKSYVRFINGLEDDGLFDLDLESEDDFE